MANFLSGLFNKERSVDFEKQSLYSKLSVANSEIDRTLLTKVLVNPSLLDAYRQYQQLAIHTSKEVVVTLKDECRLLEDFVSLYQKACGDGFYVNISLHLRNGIVFVPPFILFPIVQNALKNGYASMEKYPIKIKVTQTTQQIQLEVSNRVNHYLENQGADELLTYYRHRLDESYAGRHELFVNSNSNTFKVTLFLTYV